MRLRRRTHRRGFAGSCILIPLAVFVTMPRRAPELLASGQAWILANERR